MTSVPNKTKNYDLKGWKMSSVTTPILNAQELDDFTERLQVFAMPEMVFNSHLTFDNGDNGFCLSFNAYDALEAAKSHILNAHKIPNVKVGCAWSDKILPPSTSSELSNQFATQATLAPTSVSTKSSDPVVGEKIEERQDNIDWTFTTLYRGTIEHNGTKLTEQEIQESHDQWLQKGHPLENINFERLMQHDDILFYDDILLYQDELHDHGESRINVKTRVMSHGFFCLLRFFMRVDGVCVRIIDTRLYHDFQSKVVVREFSWHESSWEDIAKKNALFVRDPAAMDDPQRLIPMIQLRAKQIINIPL